MACILVVPEVKFCHCACQFISPLSGWRAVCSSFAQSVPLHHLHVHLGQGLPAPADLLHAADVCKFFELQALTCLHWPSPS